MTRFRFEDGGDVAGDIRDKYGVNGGLPVSRVGNTGAMVRKWHHHMSACDRNPGTRVNDNGGSLQMRRRYPGDQAMPFGTDIAAGRARPGRGYRGRNDVVRFLCDLADDMHIHDSIVVIDKAPVHAPVHSRVGG